MESFEWSAEQQEGMRKLLMPILEHLRLVCDFFNDGEVIVTSESAMIVAPIEALNPEEGDQTIEAMRQRDVRYRHIGIMEKPVKDFLYSLLGSSLYGHFEHEGSNFILRLGLKPNDIIGAEKTVANAIRRLKNNHEDPNQTANFS